MSPRVSPAITSVLIMVRLAVLPLAVSTCSEARAEGLKTAVQVGVKPKNSPKRASTPPVPQREYVNSAEDFVRHMEAHIERVEILSFELLQGFPAEFAGVTSDLLRSFVRLHDQSKVNPKLSSDPNRTVAQRLYENYGKNFKALSPEEIASTRLLVEELNGIDDRIAMDFFKKNGLLLRNGKLSPLAKRLKLAEKVADQVDRAMSPVSREEFNKVMEPASTYMTDSTEQRLARSLEVQAAYDKRVAASTYEAYVKRKYVRRPSSARIRSAGKCLRQVEEMVEAGK